MITRCDACDCLLTVGGDPESTLCQSCQRTRDVFTAVMSLVIVIGVVLAIVFGAQL